MEHHQRLRRSDWLQLLQTVAEELNADAIKQPEMAAIIKQGGVDQDKIAKVFSDARIDIERAGDRRRVEFHPTTRKALVGLFMANITLLNQRKEKLCLRLFELALVGSVGFSESEAYNTTRKEIEGLTFEQYRILAKIRTLTYAMGVMTKMANAQFELA